MFNTIKQIKGLHKSDPIKLRRFLEGVCFIARGGCQWRLLHQDYGNWRAVHKRFKQWESKGIWEKIFQSSIIDPDMELIMIDSSVVRAHACAAGLRKNSQPEQALGRSRGGFTTKIHCITEALGLPLKFSLTPGQRHDVTQATHLTKEFVGVPVLGDTAYCSYQFMDELIAKDCEPVIPSRINSKKPNEYDKFLYKERHQIECFFGKIKHFRRIFSRFEKSAASYMAFLHFVGTLIWLR